MHFIIFNIPENFRSLDLRNFFSEFIEKEGFHCFHFRHRPQSQLLDIIKRSSLFLHDSEARSDVNEKLSDHNDITDRHQTEDSSDTKPSHTQAKEENESQRNGTSKSDTQDTTSKENSGINSNSNIGSEEKSTDSRTHWLNSGLSGLASLISEKKKQIKSQDKWPGRTLEKQTGIGNSTTEGKSEKSECSSEEGDTKRSGKCNEGDSEGGKTSTEQSSLLSDEALSHLLEKEESKRCCVVDMKDNIEKNFLKRYNQKHWVTRGGDILPQRCYLLRVNFGDTSHNDAANNDYKTREELSALSLEPGRPQELIEFRPPPLMPQGNVGTPTHHFQELIRTCQMPGTLIKKLGLDFPRGGRKRRFGQVPFDYGTSVSTSQEDAETQGEGDIAFTATGHLIPSSADFEAERKRRRRREKGKPSRRPKMELEEEGEDGAEVEEWERYEPFHEDVTSQDRIKERRFEEELEVVWEKGGSGLVFYTDAQFWRAQEGDFDEQTADEWDVDMSVYYEGSGSGDKDARDGLDMRTSDKLRAGSFQPSVFKRKENDKGSSHGTKKDKGKRKIGPTPPPTIGKFEAHTKGFGRRLMEAQGWQDGQGLGVGAAGMPYALDNDGQHPHDRKGFGYHGEKLQGWSSSTTRRTQPRQHLISTVFDRPEDADPPPPPLRRPEPTTLTHRPRPH